MADPPKKLASPKLTKAELLAVLKHQTRVHTIGVLTDRVASPKEIAAELSLDVRHVRYHFKVLEELGMIELVREVRDAADGRVFEHFYRATQRAWFDRETWESIDGPKAGATAAIMGLINEDISRAILAGTFDGKSNHVSRTPLVVDPVGYEELVSFLADVLEEVFAIKERSANRLDKDSETILTMVHLIQFDLPPLGKGK